MQEACHGFSMKLELSGPDPRGVPRWWCLIDKVMTLPWRLISGMDLFIHTGNKRNGPMGLSMMN